MIKFWQKWLIQCRKQKIWKSIDVHAISSECAESNWLYEANFHRWQRIVKFFFFLNWISHFCSDFIILNFVAICKGMVAAPDTSVLLSLSIPFVRKLKTFNANIFSKITESLQGSQLLNAEIKADLRKNKQTKTKDK